MNKIEKKLYRIINEDDVVKNKKTGNVYVVKNFNPELHDKPTPAEVDTAKKKGGGKLPTADKSEPKAAGKSLAPTPKPTGKKADFKSSAEKRGWSAKAAGFSSTADEMAKLFAQDTSADVKQKGDNLIVKVKSPEEAEKVDKIAQADYKGMLKKVETDDPNVLQYKVLGYQMPEVPSNATKLKSLMPGMDTTKKGLQDVSPLERSQISTIVDKLAELGKQAKEKGEKAPNFNLCQVSIPGTNLYCDDNKGIPRSEMPQFKGTPQPGSPADKLPKDENGEADTEEFFKQMLNKKGIKVSEPVEVSPDRLKATQSELVGVKVAGMSKVLDNPDHPAYGKITAPIYVSNDGYVLDGHHRWAAVVAHNAAHPDKPIPMNVRVIDEPIVPLVKRSNKFAEDMGIRAKAADTGAGGGPQPITERRRKK